MGEAYFNLTNTSCLKVIQRTGKSYSRLFVAIKYVNQQGVLCGSLSFKMTAERDGSETASQLINIILVSLRTDSVHDRKQKCFDSG